MSISVGAGSYLDAYSSRATSSLNSNRAGDISKSVSGLSKDSSKEELTEAVKSFESYFVESMLKELKSSFSSIGGKDSTSSQMTDYYMDFAISDVASMLVDQYGGRLTEDLVAQVMRNYGIEDPDAAKPEASNINTDANTDADVSDKIILSDIKGGK